MASIRNKTDDNSTGGFKKLPDGRGVRFVTPREDGRVEDRDGVVFELDDDGFLVEADASVENSAPTPAKKPALKLAGTEATESAPAHTVDVELTGKQKRVAGDGFVFASLTKDGRWIGRDGTVYSGELDENDRLLPPSEIPVEEHVEPVVAEPVDVATEEVSTLSQTSSSKSFIRSHWKALTATAASVVVAGAAAVGGAVRNYEAATDNLPLAGNGYNPDAVVVFTGGQGRVATAFNACEAGDKLLISGVNDGTQLGTILANCDMTAGDLNIGTQDVTLGYNAIDTVGNAMELGDWLRANPDVQTVTLVTSSYHAPRSLELSEKFAPEGVEIRVQPVGEVWGGSIFEPRSKTRAATKEVVAYNLAQLGLGVGDRDDHLYNPSTPSANY